MKISLDSPFLEKGDCVVDLFLAGFLWLIFSVPIVTIGAASSALYYTTVKVVRRKRDMVWRSFWTAFKSSLKQGSLITIIYLFFAAMIGMAVTAGRYMPSGIQSEMLFWASIMISIPFLTILPWIFPVISRFRAGMLRQVFYAIHMAVRHLTMTFFLLILLFCTILLVNLFPVLLLFLPGGYAWLSSMMIERVIKEYMKKELEKYKDSEDVPWYLE